MKTVTILILTACLVGPVFAQPPPAPPPPVTELPRPDEDADAKVIHDYNMQLLERQAEAWTEISGTVRQPDERNLYIQLAESFRMLKITLEELYLAEENQQPFPYEKLQQQQGRHRKLLESAIATYGEKSPQFPPEVRVRESSAPVAEPTAVPKSTYTTESGFEVKLRLEE